MFYIQNDPINKVCLLNWFQALFLVRISSSSNIEIWCIWHFVCMYLYVTHTHKIIRLDGTRQMECNLNYKHSIEYIGCFFAQFNRVNSNACERKKKRTTIYSLLLCRFVNICNFFCFPLNGILRLFCGILTNWFLFYFSLSQNIYR